VISFEAFSTSILFQIKLNYNTSSPRNFLFSDKGKYLGMEKSSGGNRRSKMVKEDQNHDVRRWSQGEDRLVRVGMHCIPKYTKSILESMLIVIENKLSQITIPFMYFISCSCVEMILVDDPSGASVVYLDARDDAPSSWRHNWACSSTSCSSPSPCS
jgi:hypothetical protein